MLGLRGGNRIVVTTDGSEPNINSTDYNATLFLRLDGTSDEVTIKAKSVGVEAGNLSDTSTLFIKFYYVDSNYSGSMENGSFDAPLRTITEAVNGYINVVSPQRWLRIIVANGTYNEDVTLTKAVSLFASGSNAILNGRLTVNGESNTAYTVVNGLNIMEGVVVASSSSVLLSHNTVTCSTCASIRNVNISGANTEIIRNDISGNSYTAIALLTSDTVVFGNNITVNASNGIGIYNSGGENSQIINNTFTLPEGASMATLWLSTKNATVKNNKIIGGGFCVLIESASHLPRILDTNQYTQCTALKTGYTDGTEYATKVDIDNLQYADHSIIGSDLDNSGVNTAGLDLSSDYPGATDLNGAPRTGDGSGHGWSIGAVETD